MINMNRMQIEVKGNMKQIKQVKRFRVKVGSFFCSLDKRYHDLGVVIPNKALPEEAHVFNTSVAANNAIQRGYDARNAVRAGMYSDAAHVQRLVL